MAEVLENRPFAELSVGDSASFHWTLRNDDVQTWAAVTGNVNFLYAQTAQVAPDTFEEGGASGMWGASLISTLIGTRLPGLGSITKSVEVKFLGKLRVGTQITATVTVKEKRPETGIVVMDCRCVDPRGQMLLSAKAEVLAPTQKIKETIAELPQVHLRHEDRFGELLEECEDLPPATTAVAHPCSDDALTGAIQAAERGLIRPILIGPEAKIRALAEQEQLDISPYPLISAEHSHHAAEKAVGMVRAGEAELLMKGSLHTDELLLAVLDRAIGIRTERRLSHCFLLAVPTYARPFILTDAAINIAPDLMAKRDICQNAIDMAHCMGLKEPKLAILAAVETVNPAMPATLDAAALCKMADRGQITGAIVDGPLAFDNAADEDAARTKGIISPVAGKADILVVPDLEAGNMLAKQLTFMAQADAAGIVCGARVPIILTSRADSVRTRLASCAVANLIATAERERLSGLKTVL